MQQPQKMLARAGHSSCTLWLLFFFYKDFIKLQLFNNQGNINKRYPAIPAIIEYNEAVKDYNICVKIFPNNLYNKILLGKKPAKYLTQ